jgi:hypothetical protein
MLLKAALSTDRRRWKTVLTGDLESPPSRVSPIQNSKFKIQNLEFKIPPIFALI